METARNEDNNNKLRCMLDNGETVTFRKRRCRRPVVKPNEGRTPFRV